MTTWNNCETTCSDLERYVTVWKMWDNICILGMNLNNFKQSQTNGNNLEWLMTIYYDFGWYGGACNDLNIIMYFKWLGTMLITFREFYEIKDNLWQTVDN